MNLLHRNFYTRPPEIVAKDLLGKYLIRKYKGKKLIGKIVETEAYLSELDEAAHAFRGKSKANKSLFLEGGHSYVHHIHKYTCLDVVCQTKDQGGSVLIRAIEPIKEIELMKKLRGTDNLLNLTSGPGKIGMAFAIDKTLDGSDYTNQESALQICDEEGEEKQHEIVGTERIGISKSKDLILRFYIKGSEFVSKK